MLPLKNIMSDQEAAESGADDEFALNGQQVPGAGWSFRHARE